MALISAPLISARIGQPAALICEAGVSVVFGLIRSVGERWYSEQSNASPPKRGHPG